MTDREKAIVMAYTGICMLADDKFQIFHKYVEDLMGRPVQTYDIGLLSDIIKERASGDFIALCADKSSSKNSSRWIPVDPDNLPDGKVVYELESGEKGVGLLFTYEFPYEGLVICAADDNKTMHPNVTKWMPLP